METWQVDSTKIWVEKYFTNITLFEEKLEPIRQG